MVDNIVNVDIEPNRIYSFKEVAEFLDNGRAELKYILSKRLIKPVEDNKGILGSEIKRYRKRPTEIGWYDYDTLASLIPGLTREDMENWVIKMNEKYIYAGSIRDHGDGKGIKLRQAAALRFYTDMTMPR